MSGVKNLGHGALLAAFATSLGAALPQAAHAYSDFKQFAYPSNGGGGGGRFYTGSPADGYTCRICHEGGPAPEVRVHGLPLDGYKPGVEYEITVDWWDGDALSTAIELTDSEGRPAGSVRLPPESSVETPERCKQAKAEVIAGTLVSVPPPKHRSELKYFDMCTQRDRPEDCRQVISVPACGSGRVRFAWKAPGFDLGPIWFSGAVVNSNDDGNTTGDGVAEIGTLLASPSEIDAGVRTYAGCDAMASAPRTSISALLASMFGAIAALSLRARARARART
jgi:hypothetical protein